MNIKRAKEEIERTVRAYLAKDELGQYKIPAVRQRPILLMGPPGVGKTQIMEQAARDCGVALVAYTITHHTRQSAVGLPFIRQRHYAGRDVSVTEYTMSEIIASIYAKMESTGLSEGILFIDEINCVSETLAPTMLQFLQCKTFGNQAVPAGWVIVAAGNPPEYNKSVRDFDLVTLDLYYKYRDDYGVEEILAGKPRSEAFARLMRAPFDERLSLVGLLLSGLRTRIAASRQADAVADDCYGLLRQTKQSFAALPADLPDGPSALFGQSIADYEAETQRQEKAGLLAPNQRAARLRAAAALHAWAGELRHAQTADGQQAFALLREQFQQLADQRETAQAAASAALEAAFDFMEQAFGESQELVVFVTELTMDPAAHAFLVENGCERYFRYNQDLLLDSRKAALQRELAAEQRRSES